MIGIYKNKRVLVTGGSGYIGSLLVKKLEPCVHSIISLDSKEDIRKKNIWEKYLGKVDMIFHLAAQTSSKFSNKNLLHDLDLNLLPVVRLIETCFKKNIYPDIIFAGTTTQVGLTKKYPVNENFPDQPITVYDINKLAAEKYLQFYAQQTKGKAVTLRLANVYGPGPSHSKSDRGITNLMIKKALRGEDLTIYGKGNFIRDYVYIDDVVDAFILAGEYIEKLNRSYYLIGSGKGHTFKQMIELIRHQAAEKANKKSKIIYLEPPSNLSPIESRKFVANINKFSRITGWQPKYNLEQGIKNTIDLSQVE